MNRRFTSLVPLLFTILKAAVESNITFEMYVGSKTEDNGEYEDEDHEVED